MNTLNVAALDPRIVRAELERSVASPLPPGPVNQGYPFSEVRLDLSGMSSTVPLILGTVGAALMYRRRGSAPGGRLNLLGLTNFGPGDRIYAPFQQLDIFRNASSAAKGFAILDVIARPDVFLLESDLTAPGLWPWVDLLGSTDKDGTITFGASQNIRELQNFNGAATFPIVGYKRIRVVVDLYDGITPVGNTTTLSLTPWSMPQCAINSRTAGIAAAAGNLSAVADGAADVGSKISVGAMANVGASGRFRSFVIDVAGDGIMYFVADDEVGTTSFKLYVQGIE